MGLFCPRARIWKRNWAILQKAKSLAQAALRFKYVQGEPSAIQVSHFNLAGFLIEGGGDRRKALAHRLVGAMIAIASSSGRAPKNLASLAADIRASGEGRAALPGDFDALWNIVEQVEGVRFGELMRGLVGDAAACDQLFQAVVEAAVKGAGDRGEEGMSQNAEFADVARRVADRLAPSLNPGLRAAVEQELARDPLDTPPERVIEPISLAAFIVSLASFGWTVYRDLKKDHDAAKATAGRRDTEARLALLMREDESFAAGRAPAGMTSEQETLILAAVAAEVVAADPL